MNEIKELRFAELVIKPCSRVYGVAPCAASVGVTGDFKCYNSPRTCQDPSNFLAGDEQVLRWAEPTADLPVSIDAIPCIKNITRRPQVIDPGESLGTRESVTVSMHNFKHNDSGFDNYISDRGYNTYEKGTYWGKFVARWGSLEGAEFRTVDGYLGQDINDMTRRYYIVSSSTGPDANGLFSFTAKDALKLADSDKAQWPAPSSGTLLAAISDTDTSLTLTPTGIGDLEYPASGIASMGDEKVTFTRVGDVVTLTGRGLSGSELDEHDEGETFQIAAVFVSQDPAAILRDLLQDASDIDTSYLNYDVWKDEVDNYLSRLYSAEIMQPTSVKTLIEELCREAGLLIYTDLENKKIALKVLRQEVPSIAVTDDITYAGTISSKPLTDKRISDVWVYYGKKNPLEKQSEQKNYAAIYAKISSDPVVALENQPRAIREVASRWITLFNSPAAVSVADRLIARYENIPRQISFKIPSKYPATLGGQITVKSRIFEDSQGDAEDAITCQITSIDTAMQTRTISCEKVVFGQVDPPDPNLRIITISTDVLDINLRTIHDSIYSEATSGQTVRLVISAGAIIGSSSTATPSLDIGSWPSGVIIELDAGGGGGRIEGHGGSSSQDGGTALLTTYDIEIIGDLEIWGGGGGGGVGLEIETGIPTATYPGGNGGGYLFGAGASTESGQAQYPGGDGGDPGEDGGDGTVIVNGLPSSTTTGGSAGNSIDGVSYVTITGTVDIRGPQVN